jgi:hypothetical protein
MQERTVRELAGEIWSEMLQKQLFDIAPFSKFKDNADLLEQSVDLIMGVLARYEGFQIVNDEDLPVEPLPRIERE